MANELAHTDFVAIAQHARLLGNQTLPIEKGAIGAA